MTPQDRLRIDAGARHLHALGPRATAELLAQVADWTGPALMLTWLDEYQRLTPEIVRDVGADGFAPSVRAVP